MATAEQYRSLAAELRRKARFVEDRFTASEWSQLAQRLQRRAADAGEDLSDLIYEPPPPKLLELSSEADSESATCA